MKELKTHAVSLLRWSERYTRTDMVYLASSGFWMNLNFVFVSIFSFILSIAFANLLPKAEYGLYQYILALAAFLTAFTFTGMNSAVTQAVARGYEGVLRTSIRIQLAWNAIPGLIALTGSVYYFFQGNVVLGFGLLCVALSLPIINAFNSYSAFLNGKKDFRSSTLYSIAGNSFYYVSIFAGLFLIPSAGPLIFINLLTTTGAAVMLYVLTIRKYRPNSLGDPNAVSYGRHLTAMNVLSVVATHIDKILVFQFLGAASLASYALAILLPERLAGSFKGLLLAAFPRLTERKFKEIRDSIYWKSLMVTLATLVASSIYFVVAPILFRIVYPEYIDIILYSQLYSLTFISAVGHLSTIALVSHKKIRELYILNTVIPIIQIGALLLGIVMWGLSGLIYARVFSSVLFCVLAIILVKSSKDLFST